MSEKKEYNHKYYVKNKEKILERNKKYNHDNRDKINIYRKNSKKYKERMKKYHRENIKTKVLKYIGVVFCPKCGEKGYMSIRCNYNEKTDKKYSVSKVVHHYHTQSNPRKLIHEKTCYCGLKDE